MSLNSDYAMQIIVNQKVRDYHHEAAQDRLARLALEGRKPWWRRLMLPIEGFGRGAGARSAPSAARASSGRSLGASHVAR
jgi:hypothetical protein